MTRESAASGEGTPRSDHRKPHGVSHQGNRQQRSDDATSKLVLNPEAPLGWKMCLDHQSTNKMLISHLTDLRPLVRSRWSVQVKVLQLLPVTQSDIVIHISHTGSQATELDGVLKHITFTHCFLSGVVVEVISTANATSAKTAAAAAQQ